MKKVLLFILLTLLLVNSGCSTNISQDHYRDQEGDTSVSFECSHGVSSFDPSKEHLTFNGAPIELSYTFQNGGIASNFGLLLFLNGEIQPFQIDSGDSDTIGVIELEAGEEKTFTITFQPVIGQVGEILHLHIVAIFDMMSDISTPTIGPLFYQAMSQAIPIDVYMNIDADQNQESLVSDPRLIVKAGSITSHDDNETIASDMYMECQKNGSYMLGETDTIHIINGENQPVTFRMYAMVGNNLKPVAFEDGDSITIDSNSEQAIEFKLTSDKLASSNSQTLCFMAIPLFKDSNDYEGTMAYKTKTVSVNINY